MPESGFLQRGHLPSDLSRIGLLKTSGQFGIPEGPMPELEGICNSASLQLPGVSCEIFPKQMSDGWHQHGIGIHS